MPLSTFDTVVYYEDTDTGGVVYHSKYLNFCERARSELFFAKGQTPMQEGYHFVVKELSAHYFAPARLGERLHVKSSVIERKKASLRMLQEIFCHERKLFGMEVTLVCLHGDKPAKIPDFFAEVLGV
ncbi:MAG: YbgC/FadM family acyl-CoA thioesterase [Campylobacterales bacterium]|nr:YbgC/FadM family acyl-CoA thioesterase [Campylobacterales bacterium]